MNAFHFQARGDGITFLTATLWALIFALPAGKPDADED